MIIIVEIKTHQGIFGAWCAHQLLVNMHVFFYHVSAEDRAGQLFSLYMERELILGGKIS